MRETLERAKRLGRYKCPRSISSLLQTCEINCRLLGSYADRAARVDRSFIFDAAAKLRLLCIHKRSNTPLLLELCHRLGISTSLEAHRWLGTPGVGMLKPETLPRLLNNVMLRAPLIGTGIYELTFAQIVESYTEKAGGAHVDWTTSGLVELIQSGASFDGVVLEVAAATIFVANRLFNEVSVEVVRAANHKWIGDESRRLLSDDPTNVIARRELALVLWDSGDVPAALAQLDVIRQQEPDWPEPRLDLARIAHAENRECDCRNELIAVLDSPESSPMLLTGAAQLFCAIGEYDRAAASLEVVCQLKGLYGLTFPLDREVVLGWFPEFEQTARARAEKALQCLAG